MDEHIQSFKDYTCEENDDVAREYLEKAGNDPLKAMNLYFEAQNPASNTGIREGLQPTSDAIQEFKDYTGEEDDDVAKRYLQKRGNDPQRAIQLYFDAQNSPNTEQEQQASPPTIEAIQEFMDFTLEEREDVAKQYLGIANHDSSKAIQLYFESKGFQIDLGQIDSVTTIAQPVPNVTTNQQNAPKQGFMSSQELKRKWLESESSWSQRLGKGWQGIKVLGQGGFGIAGLWKYQGPKAQTIFRTRDVVVKQSLVNRPTPIAIDDDDTLEPPIKRSAYDEGRILQMLATLNSKHIVKQYGTVQDDIFNSEKVVRIFLEFCPGGDLGRLQDVRLEEGENPMSIEEVDVWAIFHCLALGVAAMDRGSEAPDILGPRDVDVDICHFE